MFWSSPSAQTALTWWKNSPAHNATMLNAGFVAIGIARQCNAAGACLWVTVHGDAVITPFTPPATGSAPAPEAAAATIRAGMSNADVAVAQVVQGPAAVASWTSTWETDFGTLALAQSGNQVMGTYAYVSPASGGAVTGTLTGTVSGDTLSGTWSATPFAPPFDSGTFRFVLAGDGRHFDGDIVYMNGEGDIWDGERAD